MEESLIEFFAIHKRLFLTLHLLGVAVGMGGATITDILFFHFLRDFRISHKEAEVMRILSDIIMIALGLFFLSGIALFASDPQAYLQSSAFLAKTSIVILLTINGVVMHKFIAPHMIAFSFLKHPMHAQKTMHSMRSIAFAMGAVSCISWYSVFLIAMLKSYLPVTISVFHLLGLYFAILCIGILTSQILHMHIHKKSLHGKTEK